jgi:hypothetical protein
MAGEKKKDENPDIDKDGYLHIKLDPDDSALIVHTDGSVEIISREMANNEGGYLGDIEDLNKTFSLVLALAASLEDEELYNMIFDNLNRVLMKQWDSLDDGKKDDIMKIREKKRAKLSPDEEAIREQRINRFRQSMSDQERHYLENERKRLIDDMRQEMEDFKNRDPMQEFPDPTGLHPHPDGLRRMKKKKVNPLDRLSNAAWNPYDKSLVTHKGQFRLDYPPPDEEE